MSWTQSYALESGETSTGGMEMSAETDNITPRRQECSKAVQQSTAAVASAAAIFLKKGATKAKAKDAEPLQRGRRCRQFDPATRLARTPCPRPVAAHRQRHHHQCKQRQPSFSSPDLTHEDARSTW
jgi:hypothetical protein